MFLDENLRLICPICETPLSRRQLLSGRKLARCSGCGNLLRVVEKSGWAESTSATASFDQDENSEFKWPSAEEESWNGLGYGTGLHDVKTEPQRPKFARPPTEQSTGQPVATKVTVEIAKRYPYPYLQCPFCEQLNYDVRGPDQNWQTQQFCSNCGADLKKECLNCGYPLYILDHFCGRCRSDQERAEYEFEAWFWQHFNEGKRLAQNKEWGLALRELSLFFGPDRETAFYGYGARQVREARRVYRGNISNRDRGEGLRLYNECHQQLKKEAQAQAQAMQRRKLAKYLVIGLVLILMGVWSASSLGSWWAIFVLIPAVALIMGGLLLMLLAHSGASIN